MSTTPAIQTALKIMRDCASDAFYAAQEFGKGSPAHLAKQELYQNARYNYEWYCAHAGVPAYATYDVD